MECFLRSELLNEWLIKKINEPDENMSKKS